MYENKHEDPVNSWLWWSEHGARERLRLVYWDRERLCLHLGLLSTTPSGRSMAGEPPHHLRTHGAYLCASALFRSARKLEMCIVEFKYAPTSSAKFKHEFV